MDGQCFADIVRKIKIKNQVGSALVDDYTKNVIVYVDSTDRAALLRNIEIEELQLGSSIAQTTPTLRKLLILPGRVFSM